MMRKFTGIKSWAEEDRPREKMLSKGRRALTDAEILAILISSGNAEESAVELSKRILGDCGNDINRLGSYEVRDFCKYKGIGEAKAITIIGALELGRRRKDKSEEKEIVIKSSRDVYDFVYPFLLDLNHEEFWVLYLNRKNKIIGKELVSKGGVSSTIVDSRVVYKGALLNNASGIIAIHNHPSGNREASKEDRDVTVKLKQAGAVLDISFLDHVIFCGKDYFSFADEGLLSQG